MRFLPQLLPQWRCRRQPQAETVALNLHMEPSSVPLDDDSNGSGEGPSLQLGYLCQAPPLPQPFVDRPDSRLPLKQTLLSDAGDNSQPLVVSAIAGLGGIGKTVLATALAHDLEIQQRFPDGILWVSLGQSPDLLPLLDSWIKALQDYEYKPTTVEDAALHLRTLLDDKRMLLVVDDIWQAEHAQPFCGGGDGCQILVTTREATIAGATRYELDVMTATQALELLTRSLSTSLSATETTQAAAVAREVGYLPLALQLVAGQVNAGVTWVALLDHLRAEVAQLAALDAPNSKIVAATERRHWSLLASFNLSLRQLTMTQLQAFAWCGVLPEDVIITPRMVVTLWQMTLPEAATLLQTLHTKALLLAAATPDSELSFRLHDLLHDYARHLLTSSVVPEREIDLPGLGFALPDAHALLLDRYRRKTADGQWYRLPDDGYIYTHLTWHLEQSGQLDALHQLLQADTDDGRNAWFEVCERLGLTASFGSDVARAWRLAEVQYTADPVQSLVLQYRYALIMSSLHSVSSNIPAKLMALLVAHGYWTAAQGLAHTQQIPSAGSRSEALLALIPHLPPALLPQAVAIARTIQDAYTRATTLIALVPYLPELVPEALTAVNLIPQEGALAIYTYPRVLNDLLPHVPAALLPGVRDAIYTLWEGAERVPPLTVLAAYLPEVIPDALAIATAIPDEGARSDALLDLVPYVPAIIPDILAATGTLADEYQRKNMLNYLVPHLPTSLLPIVLTAARELQSAFYRAQMLTVLAAYLPEVIPEAVAAARAIETDLWQSQALVDLVPYAPDIIPEALAAICAIQDAESLSKLLPYLPDTLLPTVLETAQTLSQKSLSVFFLTKLVPYLPEVLPAAIAAAYTLDAAERTNALGDLAELRPELIPVALAAAREIRDEPAQVTALIALAAHLPEVVFEALATAQMIQDDVDRADALINLLPYLPNILPEAIAIVRTIEPGYPQAQALLRLIPYQADIIPLALEAACAINYSYQTCMWTMTQLVAMLVADLPAAARTRYLPEVTAIAVTIACSLNPERSTSSFEREENKFARTIALVNLAPYAPEVIPEALETARSLQDETQRSHALTQLVPYVPEVLPEALETVRSIQYDVDRSKALIELVPHCPEVLPEALELTRSLPEQSDQATALNLLATHLPEFNAAAMAATLAIADELARESSFNYELLPHLPPSFLPEALTAARAFQSADGQARVFSCLIPQLGISHISLWMEVLHSVSHQSRSDFMATLPPLIPAILVLGKDKQQTLTGIAKALREVCRQWQ